jgi:hypothetical protein
VEFKLGARLKDRFWYRGRNIAYSEAYVLLTRDVSRNINRKIFTAVGVRINQASNAVRERLSK